MLVSERRRRVVAQVQRQGSASVTELAALLGVSGMTIRRDLDVLSADGLLDKVHGGATVRRPPSTEELGFEETSQRARSEKGAIAARARALVRPGMSIGLSGGSTTWALAQALREVPDLTLVTNSLRIAEEFHHSSAQQAVVLTGGVRTPSDALVGPVAVRALQVLHCDLVFLGVHGIDEHAGFTTPNIMEAETNRALVETGQEVVVLADHSKWGRVGLTTIVDLDAVDHLVTDDQMPPDAVQTLREHIGTVDLVSTAPGADPAG